MQMRAMDARSSRRRGGFTLLEVLLVIAIMGMLAALVAPNVMATGERARIDVTRLLVANSGPIATQINLYKLRTGVYPAGLDDLCRRPNDAAGANDDGPEAYIGDAASFRDVWGQELQYKCPGQINKSGYDLYSFGPDMKEGGGDDIGNWTAAPLR
jgi:general secretion pathway protein G